MTLTATLRESASLPTRLTVQEVAEIEGVTAGAVRVWCWQWNVTGGARGLRRQGARIKYGIQLKDYIRFAAGRGTLPERWAEYARERGWL